MNLEDLKLGVSVPCREGEGLDGKPEWLDMDKFRRGQQFFQKHIVVATLAMHISLVSGFSLVSLLDALVFTEKSNTPGKAIKRYLETFIHIYRWHTGDVWNNPNDPAYQSVRLVRKMHQKVAKGLRDQSEKKKSISSDGMQSSCKNHTKVYDEQSGVYLSQYDMALVQVGFMGAITMYPSQFGLVVTSQELENYIHFWRGIGHILGVKDEFNVCKGNYKETFNICKEIESDVLMEGLKDPGPKFGAMADAYCNGVNGMLRIPVYTKEAVIAFAMDGMGRDFRLGPVTWSDWIRVMIYRLFLLLIRWVPGFETCLNARTIKNFDSILRIDPVKRAKAFNELAARLDVTDGKKDI